MKTIDLSKEQHSLNDVLALAKEESVFIHSSSGEDFSSNPPTSSIGRLPN